MTSNLVYYAAVSRGNVVLAEHKNAKEDMAEVAVECLEKLPAFHTRFTYTIKQRMFLFLMHGGFTYSAIVDEALGKRKSFGFLERVKEEFQLLLHSRGLDGSRLETHALVVDFAGVFKHLVKPLVGLPQKEVDLDDDLNSDSKDNTVLSPSASQSEHFHSNSGGSSPLTGSNGTKQDRKAREHEVKEIMMTNVNNSSKALDKGLNHKYEGVGGRPSDNPDQRKASRQHASRLWWRNVKLVLILDLAVCCILFAIWLGICRGFSCVKN